MKINRTPRTATPGIGRPCIILALIAATTLALAAPASGQSAAAAARTCSLPRYPGLGYFTSLSVTGTSCATGDKLIVAYYRCRTRSSPAGRCHSTVLGFTCHEQRNSIPTEIDARATCRRAHATVIHTYQQDT